MFYRISLAFTLVLALATSACSVNPVTGEKELTLMPLSQQIALGEKNYQPYQQQQGGRYSVDPDLNLYVSSVGRKLAAVSDQPGLPYEFVVLNNPTPNAWALPGGKIAINRGLLLMLEDEAQLAAVLAHEIVHAAAGHTASQMTRSTLLGLGASVLTNVTQQTEYADLISQGVSLGTNAWMAKYGRGDELQADAVGIKYMVKAGYETRAAVELQQKFVALAAGRQSDVMSTLFASHPPSQQRVDKNRELASQSPTGKRNQAAFKSAMKQLTKDARAYELHQEALKAASEKNVNAAQQKIAQAIAIQNAEALFHITAGQLDNLEKQPEKALAHFQRATSLNPDYVASYLHRGLTEKALKKYEDAAKSLEASMQRLPTAVASYHLGELKLNAGQVAEAQRYFEFAAQDQGEIGAAAREQLAKLSV